MRDNDINLHVCCEDKFIPSFIGFVKENFPDATNVYYINSRSRCSLYDPSKDRHRDEEGGLKEVMETASVIRLLYASKRIVLHGFTNKYVILFLAMNPWLHAKCYWSIWGSELYFFKKRKSLPEKAYEVFRSSVIRGVGHILTYIPGDVELARKWYGAKGKHVECLMYTSNVITDKLPDNNGARKSGPLKIMVGNSADPSNRHLYIFEKLKGMEGVEYSIISPLSYGDKQHALEISSLGKSMFGERFFPLMEFMCYEDYLELLGDIDVAIFAHERQQAMGNIIMLLASGKKVYMNKSSTLARLLRDIGVVIFDVDELNLDPIGEKDSDENIRIVKERFNTGVLKQQLRAICD